MNNQTINELCNRNLDSCLFSITCISTTIYFREEDGFTTTKNLYIFYGCNLQGVRKFLAAAIASNYEKVSDWYNFFLKLKKRNLNIILYANLPDNKMMKEALSLTFNEITPFISCFEPINKIFKYYSNCYSSNVFNIVKNIYLSETTEEYTIALNEFYQEFSSNQFLIDLLYDDLKNIKKYYEYDVLIRKHVFTFYFYRDISKAIKALSHSKPYFTSIEEFVELMIPTIKRTEMRMYSTKNEWISLLNLIYTDKKELIKCYL